MKFFMTQLILLGLLAPMPIIAGCDKTLHEQKTVEQKPDGSVETTKQKTTQSPNGDITKTTEKDVDQP
jgi:hypothetical protein